MSATHSHAAGNKNKSLLNYVMKEMISLWLVAN